MTDKLKVGDYMTYDVDIVSPDSTVADVIGLIERTGHESFPVVRNGKVDGYVTSTDLLLCGQNDKISKVMSTDLVLAHQEMDLADAARVMFRTGMSKLPVVDKHGKLIGLLSNADVIRSQIERADPKKVWKLKRTLETIHDVKISVANDKVAINQLVPTQSKIYADELEGRTYELKKGMVEPIVVIRKPGKLLLVDGHHRVIAARKLGIDTMDAYILILEKDISLGMEKTARNIGLHSLNDIKILDYPPHPLVEFTRRGWRRLK
ncbi:MAG: CBS domain-containing protein [Methanosarcinales archaeon Met12]|nr:MAG: CBS domain-containing protein [Methanosarcinales archaeon Met12]